MNIKDVMTVNPICCPPGVSLKNAAEVMRDEDIGEVPIVQKGGGKKLVYFWICALSPIPRGLGEKSRDRPGAGVAVARGVVAAARADGRRMIAIERPLSAFSCCSKEA